MAWNDPSPRSRGRSSASDPSAGPGYATPEVRLSFVTILARTAMTVVVGACLYAGVRSAIHAWLPDRHAGLDIAVPLAVAVIAGWLLLRFLLRQPPTVGLPDRVRDGRGWFGRRRDWDDDYGNASLGQVIAAEATADVIGAALDATLD